MMPTSNNDIPSLRTQYDLALAHNQAAKARLANLLDQSNTSTHIQKPNPTAKKSSQDDKLDEFNLHLDILRLRKDYQRKRIILDHLQRAEDLAQSNGIYSLPKQRSSSSFDDVDAERSIAELQGKLDALLERSKRLTSDLEDGLYEARVGLKRERAMLEQVKGERERVGVGGTGITPEGRLVGLKAVRGELGAWIEGILGRCEEGEDEDVTAVDGTVIDIDAQPPVMSKAEFDAVVDGLQERYVVACGDIQAYSKALQDFDAVSAPTIHEDSRPTATIAAHAQLGKRHPGHPPPSTQHVPPSLTLNALEHTQLPERIFRRTLEAHVSHLDSEVALHNAALSSSLQRLSHESHLLPAYPLLAHDERFVNARRVFGTNTGTGGVERSVDGEDGKGQGKTEEEREVERLLAAWGFAVESAEERNFESVGGMVKEGESSLGRAEMEREGMGVLEGKVREIGLGV